MSKPNISIVGTGYVGLTTASIFANCGYKTYTIDRNQDKLDIIKSGRSYFYEAGLDDLVEKGLKKKKLIPTLSYKKAISDSQIVFICVGTPSNRDGSVDLNNVFQAIKKILLVAKNDLIIVQKSTVPIETGKRIKKIVKDFNKNNLRINFVSSPEFLRESSAVFDTLYFDRLVVGSNDEHAREKIVDIYRDVANFAKDFDYKSVSDYAFLNINPKYIENLKKFEDRVIRTNLESAELIKVASNSFLSLKISFANTLSRICAKTGACVQEVTNGMGSDPRIGKAFLSAGLGYGGGCFPKDVMGMINTANAYDVDFGILDQVEKVNNTQVYFALNKIRQLLNDDLRKKKVAFLGLSFKPGTSDIRKSPSMHLIEKLLYEEMKVRVYDPQAIKESKKELEHPDLTYCEKINDVFTEADIIVLGTEWKEFINFDYSSIKSQLKQAKILDARNVLNQKKLKQIGFEILGF